MGYYESNLPENCDLIILNTCHIREKASEKMYSDIGRLSIMKQNRKKYGNDLKIVIAGCVAQAEGKEILNRNRDVDIVVGPQTYHKLPELLKRNEKLVLNDFPNESKFDFLPLINKPNHQHLLLFKRDATNSVVFVLFLILEAQNFQEQ